MSAIPTIEPDRLMTEAEYVAFETASEVKHEFVDGHVYDWPGYDYDVEGLAGATRTHNQLQVNLLAALVPTARAAGCQAYGSDMRLRVRLPLSRRYYYPDAMVVCDQQMRAADGDDELHVTRPCLVFEILSRRSVRIDHTEKLQAYQALPSVLAYVIVHQRQQRVECHYRDNAATWQAPLLLGPDDSMQLPCVNASVRIADIYA